MQYQIIRIEGVSELLDWSAEYHPVGHEVDALVFANGCAVASYTDADGMQFLLSLYLLDQMGWVVLDSLRMHEVPNHIAAMQAIYIAHQVSA